MSWNSPNYAKRKAKGGIDVLPLVDPSFIEQFEPVTASSEIVFAGPPEDDQEIVMTTAAVIPLTLVE